MKFVNILLLATATVALSAAGASAEPAPSFKICSGKPDGSYNRAANYLKRYTASYVDAQVVVTKGTMDNIERMKAGECDAAFVQRDGLIVASQKDGALVSKLDIAGNLVTEYGHLICNRKSGISKAWQLTKDNVVAVGDLGGGSGVSWQSLSIVAPKTYKPIALDPLGRSGLRALNAVASGEITCAFQVAGEGSGFFTSPDAQELGKDLVLVRTDDTDLESFKDAKGAQLYKMGTLSGDVYKKLTTSGMFSYADVGAFQVQSVLVVSSDWISKYEIQYDGVLKALTATRRQLDTELAAKK